MINASIMQPTFFPWIGYFDLIDSVDKFVFLDNVQVLKRYWDVRNRIKTSDGELFLTVPLKKTKSRDDTKFCNAIIDYDQPWQKEHLKSIEFAYHRSKHFKQIYPLIKELIDSKEKFLSILNIKIIRKISEYLGIKKKFILASELKNIEGFKDKLLVSICKAIDCDCYLSPKGAAVYIEKNNPGGVFTLNNILLKYQNYQHPVYRQLYGNFIPYLSIIDLLFNEGKNSLSIIKKGTRE